MLAAVLAGLVVRQAPSFVPIIISRATSVMFVLPMFNFLMGTRWSFHAFHRIGRFLARPARRLVIMGADARGAAAVQHLHSTDRASAELLGLLDDDGFKRGKLFHGYRVLGSLDDLATIMARTPFDEIVIAQETLSAAQPAFESFTVSHSDSPEALRLGVTDVSVAGLQIRSSRSTERARIRAIDAGIIAASWRVREMQ